MSTYVPELNGNYSDMMLIVLVIPEYFYLIIFLLGIYGMFCGIEIMHPLYAVLYINLIVPTTLTVICIVFFPLIETPESYIKLSNLFSYVSVFFHCTTW